MSVCACLKGCVPLCLSLLGQGWGALDDGDTSFVHVFACMTCMPEGVQREDGCMAHCPP